MGCRHIDRLKTHSQDMPDAPAILAPGKLHLSFKGLWEHIQDVAGALNSGGFGRGDRIAIVLPNGPEMATCLLAVSACATAAPLNPAYSESEFDFYLLDVGANALMVEPGSNSPAIGVARRRGMAIIELAPVDGASAGVFRLHGLPEGGPRASNFAECEDVAVLLHTSGTTSRPKLVPLTHANLFYSAVHFQNAFVSAGDRCLNLLPLFHGYGLKGALLSPLTSGGSVVCAPGFDAEQFFGWIEEFQPAWYAAVPAVHQAVAKIARGHMPALKSHTIRYIGTGSSVTPSGTLAELESIFGAPVIDVYGMTETSLIASSPLPPRERKAGSVGVTGGLEIAVMDESGSLLGPGGEGEVVVRGPSVIAGYEKNPEADQAAFTAGWFRTGDRGYLDAGGYVFLTGRIKEMINRGGEKISPHEITQVLLEHPSVAEALAFAVPHPTLGEDVAAAVVLRSGETARGRELRQFAAARLAQFKVPRRVAVVDEIPKGSTGKPQWIGLAQKMGISTDGSAAKDGFQGPRDSLQFQLVQIWEELLGIHPISVRDNFFELGGDSLLAVQMLDRIGQVCGKEVPPSALFDGGSVEQIADILVQQIEAAPPPSLIQVQRGDPDSNPTFVFLHGDFVTGGYYCLELARGMGTDQPFYALQPHGLDGKEVPPTIEEMAADQLRRLRSFQPEGPYFLGGYCNAAQTAFEMARQLRDQREAVKFLALVHGWAGRVCTGSEAEWDPEPWAPTPEELNSPDYYVRKGQAYSRYGYAVWTYRPRPYTGRINLFWPCESPLINNEPLLGWDKVAQEVEFHSIPGEHTTCITTHARQTGQLIATALRRAQFESEQTVAGIV